MLTRNFCKVELSLAIANSVTSELCYKSSYIKNVKSVLTQLSSNFQY